MKFENPENHFTKGEIDAITKALQAAQDISFLETLMEIIPSPIFYKDQNGVYKFCNKAFCDYVGLSKHEIINHTVFDIAPMNLANIYHQADLDLIQSKGNQIYESMVRYHDGTNHDIMFHKTAHVNEIGETLGLVGVMVDITTQKNSERLIQRQNVIKDVLLHISHVVNQESDRIHFFNLLLDEIVHHLDHIDYGSIFEIENEGVKLIATNGHNLDDSKGFSLPFDKWLVLEHAKVLTSNADYIDDISIYIPEEIPEYLKTIDGRHIHSMLYIPIIVEENKTIILVLESAAIGTFSDVDLNIAEYIQLQIPIVYQIFSLNKKTLQLSRYDALTGLMNRGYFSTIFEDRLKMARREKTILSLVMFDLDGLKIINDNFGHAAGDAYLEHFADFVKTQFRSTDTFARIGGDEFLGIFSTTDHLTLKKKLTLLQTLYTQLEIHAAGENFNGRFSYGIATYPHDAESTDGLMTIADIKMYSDKKNSKK